MGRSLSLSIYLYTYILYLRLQNVSPVFLVFLECVWQLLQQYPPSFQFSETYLTVLSDSLHVPVFSTFLFNSQHHRHTFIQVEALHLLNYTVLTTTYDDIIATFGPWPFCIEVFFNQTLICKLDLKG